VDRTSLTTTAIMPSALSVLGLAALSLSSLSAAQRKGRPDSHPSLTTQTCTKDGGCTTHTTSIVLDALTHAITTKKGVSCTANGGLNETICPTVKECAKNCEIEGITDYSQYGVTTDGDALHLQMYLNGQSVSPRVYLLDDSGQNYDFLKLNGQEFSFDTDVSNLPCGMNGALYLSAMEADGGRSALNPAGAAYGTGYCDAQCFNTSSFINGKANVNHLGACCNEMDIWEANSVATSIAPHTCSKPGFYACSGEECDLSGVCDKYGCSFNPYSKGKHHYYGHGDKVDTTKPFTVVTQFVTNDGTTTGTLQEIRRLYVQDGKTIKTPSFTFSGGTANSVDDAYCDATADLFTQRGGLAEMGDALGLGMVLCMSIWNDAGGYMNWLDAGDAGPCGPKQGMPSKILKQHPDTDVVFSNIKWGDIGSTY
jgi:cellulase